MHPIVQKFISREMSEPMATTLLSGGLPLPIGDLLCALFHAVFSQRIKKKKIAGGS
jgi:hypothetical protein